MTSLIGGKALPWGGQLRQLTIGAANEMGRLMTHGAYSIWQDRIHFFRAKIHEISPNFKIPQSDLPKQIRCGSNNLG